MKRTIPVSHLVTGPLAVNTWFIGCDPGRVVVVDPGGEAKPIIAHLSALKVVPALFFLTHGHFDHISALSGLHAAWPDVPIALHPSDSTWLGPGAIERHRTFFTRLGCGWMVDRYGSELPPANILLIDGEPVLGSKNYSFEDWTIIHTPGHTPGCVSLYNAEAKILISGDTLFKSGMGRTDGPGGSMSKLESSLKRLFALPADTRVLTGHGEETLIGDESGW